VIKRLRIWWLNRRIGRVARRMDRYLALRKGASGLLWRDPSFLHLDDELNLLDIKLSALEDPE
jgi:hypothetical protein